MRDNDFTMPDSNLRGGDRRAENADLLRQLQQSYAALEKRVNSLQKELDENTKATQHMEESSKKIEEGLEENTHATKKLESNTHELVETFNTLKGGLTVMGWLGKLGEKLIWLGIPGAFVIYGWNAIKAWMIGGPK